MPVLTGGSFKEISPDDIQVRTTALNQLIDIIQEDISGSQTRKAYQVFVTGGVGPGVTSSLFQTVFDQDFTLQTANPIFDMTVGLHVSSSAVESTNPNEIAGGKLLFPSSSLMMREKIDIYRQYAATLLGDPNDRFKTSRLSAAGLREEVNLDHAVFMSFKRLFARDSIKRETFALRVYRSASYSQKENTATTVPMGDNLSRTSELGKSIFTDLGAAQNRPAAFGGEFAELINTANPAESVGLIYYQHGTVVLDAALAFSASQHISGTIGAMANAQAAVAANNRFGGHAAIPAGFTVIGSTSGNKSAKLIPDLFVSASIDDIVDHLAATRFSSGSLTSMTFQNVTNINSTLVFCRAAPDEFNYSANVSYIDPTTGKIRVIDTGEDNQRSFTFPTTIGLHDAAGKMLAVAKMSRPIEKNDEKDITFRVRLDF